MYKKRKNDKSMCYFNIKRLEDVMQKNLKLYLVFKYMAGTGFKEEENTK